MRIIVLLFLYANFVQAASSSNTSTIKTNESSFAVTPKLESSYGNTSNIAFTNKKTNGSFFKLEPSLESTNELQDNVLWHNNFLGSVKRFNNSFDRSLGDAWSAEILSGLSWYINENYESNTEIFFLRNEDHLIYDRNDKLVGIEQKYNEFGFFQSIGYFSENWGLEAGPTVKIRNYSTSQEDDNGNAFKNSYLDYGGMVKYNYSFSKNIETKLKANFNQKNYDQRMANYTDGTIVEFGGNSPTLKIFSQNYQLGVNYAFLKMDLETSGNINFDKDQIYASQDSTTYSGSQSISIEPIKSLKAKIQYSITNTRFKNLIAYDEQGNRNGKRTDIINTIKTDLNYKFSKLINFGANYSYLTSSSNESKQKFDEHLFLTKAGVTF